MEGSYREHCNKDEGEKPPPASRASQGERMRERTLERAPDTTKQSG
jgi:hypothetical protein